MRGIDMIGLPARGMGKLILRLSSSSDTARTETLRIRMTHIIEMLR